MAYAVIDRLFMQRCTGGKVRHTCCPPLSLHTGTVPSFVLQFRGKGDDCYIKSVGVDRVPYFLQLLILPQNPQSVSQPPFLKMTQDIQNTHGDDVTVTIKTETTVQTDEVTTGSSSPVANGVETPNDFDNGVAIRPNAAKDIPDLLKKVSSLGAEYAGNTDEDLRAEYLDAARHLVYALETPREAMIRYCWSQVLGFTLTILVPTVLTYVEHTLRCDRNMCRPRRVSYSFQGRYPQDCRRARKSHRC